MTDEEKNETQEEETPEAEAAEETPEAAQEPAAPEEPQEQLSPREARRRARSQHTGEVAPQRSPEERAAERVEARKKKAAERSRYRVRKREKDRAGREPKEPRPPQPGSTGKPRLRQGVVISDKADKTITVRIDVARQHRVYGKIVRTSSTLHAHDERNEASAGDTVRVVESRPLSRTKRWRLVDILERAR